MGKRGGKRGGSKCAERDDEQERAPQALPQVADSPTGKRGGKRGKRTNNNHNGFSTGAFGIMGEDIGDSSLNQSDLQSPERAFGKGDGAFTGTEKGGVCAGFGDGTNSPRFGDHDGQSDMKFPRSRNPSFVSHRDAPGNHEFSNSNRSRANSGAFDVDVDNYGSFGPPTGNDIDEDGDGFNDRQFPIRSVQNDEKFVNHRLSKLSISTNADEFVLVGGHPPNVADGRGSVMSTRSAVSRKSMLRSSDFLASGENRHDWIGGSVRSSGLSQSSKSIGHGSRNASDNNKFVCEEAQNSIESRAFDCTSPDYVTAPGSQFNSGHHSRSTSRSQSRRSSVSEANQFNNNDFGNTGFGGDSHGFRNSRDGFCDNGTNENDHFGGEYGGFGGNKERFGGSHMSNRSRAPSHASFANNNGNFDGDSNEFGDSAARFGGSHMSNRSRASSRHSYRSDSKFGATTENNDFGTDSNGFGESRNRFGGSSRSNNRSRASSHDSYRSGSKFGATTENNNFGTDSNGFGESHNRFGGSNMSNNRSRASSRASVRSETKFDETNENNAFGADSNGFVESHNRFGGSTVSNNRSRAPSHASIRSDAKFGETTENNAFGNDSNGFGESDNRFGGSTVSNNRSRASSHDSDRSGSKFGVATKTNNFGNDSNGFGESDNRFGGSTVSNNRSRAPSHASIRSEAKFGETNENNAFGAESNGFGESDNRFGGSIVSNNRSRAPSHASIRSEAKFGETNENNAFGADSNGFGESNNRFGGSNMSNNRNRASSRASVRRSETNFGETNENNAFRNDSNGFGESDNRFGGSTVSNNRSRAPSHASIVSLVLLVAINITYLFHFSGRKPNSVRRTRTMPSVPIRTASAKAIIALVDQLYRTTVAEHPHILALSDAKFGEATENNAFGTDSNGFGENNRFGGSTVSNNRSRARSHASLRSEAKFGETNENNAFGADSNGFGENNNRFGGSNMSNNRSRASSRASVRSETNFGETNENNAFGNDSNGFGESDNRFGGSTVSNNRSRAPSHASIRSDAKFGETTENNAFGADSHGFGENRFGGSTVSNNRSRAPSHASLRSEAKFGETNENNAFGADSNGFGENRFGGSTVSNNRSRTPSHASLRSEAKFGETNENNAFGVDSNGFGENNNRFGGSNMSNNRSRASSRASVRSETNFGETNENNAFGNDSNGFGESDNRFGGSTVSNNRSRAPSHASLRSEAKFGETNENNAFGEDSNGFGESNNRFGGSNMSNNRSRASSRASIGSETNFGETNENNAFGNDSNGFCDSDNRFGGSTVSNNRSRAPSHASIRSEAKFGETTENNAFGADSHGFGENRFGGSTVSNNRSRAPSHASIRSEAKFDETTENNAFGAESNGFGESNNRFGGSNMSNNRSRASSRASVRSETKFGETNENNAFCTDSNGFGESHNRFGGSTVSNNRSRAPSHASIRSEAKFGETTENNAFGADSHGFGENRFGGSTVSNNRSRAPSHASIRSEAKFDETTENNAFGAESNGFGESNNRFGGSNMSNNRSRASSRASVRSETKFGETNENNAFCTDSNGFGESHNRFGGSTVSNNRSRAPSHASIRSETKFGETNENNAFGTDSNGFGESHNRFGGSTVSNNRSRAPSHTSIRSDAKFGEATETNNFGTDSNGFGENRHRFGGSNISNNRSRAPSHASIRSETKFGETNENNAFGKDSNGFGESDNRFGGSTVSNNHSRAPSHASLRSDAKFGETTEHNAFGTDSNGFGENHNRLGGSSMSHNRSRAPSHASIRSETKFGETNENNAFGKDSNGFGECDNRFGGSTVSNNRSRASSHVSVRSGCGDDTEEHLLLADMNSKLESHLDLRSVDRSQISIGRSNRAIDRSEPHISMKAENFQMAKDMQPIPVARPRSVSQSGQLMQQVDKHVISRNPSIRSEMGPPKAMTFTDALTPRTSRISQNQVENSPAVFNQTQFDKNEFAQRRSNLRSDIFNEAKTSCEIAVQTGETIRLRQNPHVLSISSQSRDCKHQTDQLPLEQMANFGKPNFNSSFEKKGHPATSVLTSMLQQRVANSTQSSGQSAVSSHQTTVIDNYNQPTIKHPVKNSSPCHNYDTRTNENWSSNTRTTWQETKVDENSNVVMDTGDQRHLDNWLHDGAKHIMPKETTDELRMKVLSDSRPPLTPKSSRTTGRLDDSFSKSNRVSCRQTRGNNESLSQNNMQGARITEQSSTMDRLSTGSGTSPYRWQWDGRTKPITKNNDERKPDARWVEGLDKEPGRTVRKNVRPGKIRDLASMFNQMQDKAVKEAAVLVLNSRPINSPIGVSPRQRRQSEPSLNGSFRNDYAIDHVDGRAQDESFKNMWQYSNGLDGALLDGNDYSEPESVPDRRRTSTPLDTMMDQRGQMAAQFQRVPSIRGEDVRQGRSLHRGAGGVRSLAASFEHAKTKPLPLIGHRSSSASSKGNAQRGSFSAFTGSSDHDHSKYRSVSRQHSGSYKRSYSVQPAQKRRANYYDEEPTYAQVIRVSHSNNVQSPTSKRSSTVSNSNMRTLPKFPDIVEENVNGHIDNLFDFVQEHDEDDNLDVGGYSEVDGPWVPPKPLNYSVSGYRERQRTLRVNEGVRHDDPIRFSPTVAPHVGELTNASIRRGTSNKISYTPQPNSPSFGTRHPHSGRSFGAAGFSTSTPRESPHGTVVRGVHPEDASFVSSITEGSQRGNGIGDYKHQINKLQHQIHCNGEQIGMMQKVLTQARKEKKPLQELSAQRTLLVARERVLLLRKELSRVEAMSQIRRAPPPLNRDLKGSMVISNITVMLNKEFYQGHNDMNSSYAFVVLLKCGSEVEATAPVTLLAYRQNRLRQLYFAEKVNFGNLPVDFRIQLEVYAMVLPEQKHDDLSCATNIANKCRNLLIPAKRPVRSVNGLPVGEFIRCGFLRLTRDTTASTTFYLDEAEYPLEGTIEVHSRCSTLPPAIEVDYRGFLTMYQTVSGMSSWERYWAVLRRGSIYFWKYPDDESMDRSPKAHLDLTTCTRDEITSCTPDQCPRPYTFSVDILMATAPSVMDRKRIMLSADSRELMNAWLEALNETLAVIRG